MYDIIIIGAGPAGISAGLYAKRSGLNVLILYNGESNLEKATEIENYYGFPNGISGNDLYKNGLEQAKNLKIDIKNEEVYINNITSPTCKEIAEKLYYDSYLLFYFCKLFLILKYNFEDACINPEIIPFFKTSEKLFLNYN